MDLVSNSLCSEDCSSSQCPVSPQSCRWKSFADLPSWVEGESWALGAKARIACRAGALPIRIRPQARPLVTGCPKRSRLSICPSFSENIRANGEIHSLNDVVVDQMHQPWRTFAALINKSLSGKTTGLDKLRLSRAQILWGMYHQKNVDYVELLWEDFIYQIDNKAYKKQEKMYYPRFTKVIIHYFLTQDKTLSWRNKIGMHTSKDDYLINTLRFVSAKEETQIYGAILPESLTSPEMKETKAYKTYLVSTEEPTGKSKRVKRPAKKSTKALARGIELLSKVALAKDAQFEEVQRKSMRDFHKTHPSGSGTITKTAPSAAKIKPSVTNEGTGVKPGVLDVTEEESSEMKDEIVKTPSNDSDDEDETKITDKAAGDEDEEMDYTTSQLYDDVDIRLNEPVDTHKGFVQEEGIDAAMTNVQQGNENLGILQVIEDAHVTLSTVP
ncbi:hypothetical protein Tco_0769256 [Tanacetum coccineum]|uniref:Uncharacterized protein n=1 Tax=Tanacetum coccineum TaxID=301880 RepID=A0ABQ4ZC55_9ASTR